MDVYDFGREKRFKHSSSLSAVFPINLHTPHFCSAVCGHISPHIQSQQAGCGRIRTALAPLSTAALCWTQKWQPWSFCPLLEREKTLKTGWDQRCLRCPISTACHPLMSLDWDNSGDPNLLLHQQLPVQVCLGSPSDEIHAYGHARNGSRTASSDFVLYPIRLQALYSLAMPGYFYCPRDWKQKKNVLSLGWRICPYLFQLNLTLVGFSTSSF